VRNASAIPMLPTKATLELPEPLDPARASKHETREALELVFADLDPHPSEPTRRQALRRTWPNPPKPGPRQGTGTHLEFRGPRNVRLCTRPMFTVNNSESATIAP